MADLESRWRESEIFLMLIGNHHLIRTLKAVPGTQTTAVFIYADRADRQLWAGGPTDEQRSRREHEVLRQYLAEPRLYDQVVLNCFGKDAFLAHTRMVFEHFLAGAVSV